LTVLEPKQLSVPVEELGVFREGVAERALLFAWGSAREKAAKDASAGRHIVKGSFGLGRTKERFSARPLGTELLAEGRGSPCSVGVRNLGWSVMGWLHRRRPPSPYGLCFGAFLPTIARKSTQ